MIRHRCAACGAPINRIDRFFEDSDGTLCAACLAHPPAPGLGEALGCAARPPAWALLPELARPEAPAWALLPESSCPLPGQG